MCSISCSKINQQFGRDENVSVWGFRQQAFPVPLWDRVIPAPLPCPFLGYTKIGSHLLPAPRFNNFCETFHSRKYGVFPQRVQGVSRHALSCQNGENTRYD